MPGFAYCPYCGKPLGEGMAFCPYCGKKLPITSSTIEEKPAPAPKKIEPVGVAGDVLTRVDPNLTKIVVPTGVKIIESGVFRGNKVIREVVLPEGLLEIGRSAFSNCINLSRINLPSSLRIIGEKAFSSCSSITSLSFGSNLHLLGEGAFSGCNKLESASFYSSLESLPSSLFEGCTALREVMIPEGPSEVASSTFLGCSSLTTIYLPTSIKKVSPSAFEKLPITSISLKGVETIGEKAFSFCKNLSKVDLGYSPKLTKIGKSAFYHCESLTSFTFPSSLTRIEDQAFFGSGLTSVSLGNNITYIGDAFSSTKITSFSVPLKCANNAKVAYCKNLRQISFPYGMTTIPDLAYCSNPCLSSLSLPSTITSIGSGAFQNDTSLTSVTIPDGVTKIDMATFYKCSSLTSVYLGRGVRQIAVDSFYGCPNLTLYVSMSRLEMFNSHAWLTPKYYQIKAIKCSDGYYDEEYYRSRF
ncbi:MAG: leucine-rich repeat protein [Bacilli bacterium]|nr:leucine-rich repeat protein [Bacilli bacterium]